jgi:two-component system response regulator LytT
MKALIIEDEAIAAGHLTKMLLDIEPSIDVLPPLDSIESSVQFLSTHNDIDLIFLDIELGDGQSFDIFKKVNVQSPIIFTTSYEEHALKAFKLNSVDYLLKPIKEAELSAALQKFKKLHVEEKLKMQYNLLQLLQNVQNGKKAKERYLAKVGTRLTSVSADQIAFFYTRDKMLFIKTFSNQDFIIDKRLEDIERETDPTQFFRANRQFIINYNSVQAVHTWFNGKIRLEVAPEPFEKIIVSRQRAAEFRKWLGE